MLSEHAKYFVGFRGSDFAEPAYLALEFVEWPTLKAMRQDVGTLSPIDVTSLGIEILRGVRWMERRRMVHRDLKPENIFAERTEGGFQVKIADLGVWIDSGESADTSLFGTGDSMRLAGTPSYMSPEQMRGEILTSASDLHMVASVLWELATGSVPYPMRSGSLLDTLRERGERIRSPASDRRTFRRRCTASSQRPFVLIRGSAHSRSRRATSPRVAPRKPVSFAVWKRPWKSSLSSTWSSDGGRLSRRGRGWRLRRQVWRRSRRRFPGTCARGAGWVYPHGHPSDPERRGGT